jgi:hypothetical protein
MPFHVFLGTCQNRGSQTRKSLKKLARAKLKTTRVWPPALDKLKGLTYSTLTEEQKEANRNSYTIWDIIFSLIVVAIVAFIMLSFNGK